MKEPTHDDVLDALKARSEWERRQSTWYQMRHDGLRRRNKPWPNAADMHFPLADMLIEKLKPTYIAQIYAQDLLASFVSQSSSHQSYQDGAAQWFDYQVKQETNFEDELPIACDMMLQCHKAIVKVYWNPETKEMEFEAVNPLHIIVPPWTNSMQKADWIVHVQTYSKTAYSRLPGFATDEGTLEALAGGESHDSNNYEASKYQREGITRPTKDDQIVVWEMFIRQDDNSWLVKTYSPSLPEKELRAAFGLPYNKGIFAKEQPPPPFAELNNERKERGYYSGRGICERVLPHEVSLSKDWNTLKDQQSITGAPVFSAPNGGVPQNANLRMVPGQILPFKLEAVTFPPAPTDIGNNMNGTRALAEQLVALPDAGIGRQDTSKEKRTAAEVNLIGGIMGRNDDLRTRLFKRELAHLYNLAWSILIQYKTSALEYFVDEEMLAIEQEAFNGTYRIVPNGSADNMNRGLVMQKAIARKQLFTNNPNIDQVALDVSVLEADDPRLVKRLVLNQGTQQAQQLEDQASEISIMLIGFPAEVRPTDNDWAHIQSLVGFTQRRATTGEPLTVETLTLLATHTAQHAEQMAKKDKVTWQERGPSIQQFIQTLQQEAQAMQQPAPPEQMANVVPMGGIQ